MFVSNGRILIHQGNNESHLDEAVEKIERYLLEELGIEAEFMKDEESEFPTYHIPEGVKFEQMEHVLRPYLLLRAINQDIFLSPEKQKVNVKYTYDEDDLKEIADALSQGVLKKHELEGEKKRVMDQYKKRIDEINALIDSKAQNHSQGYEYRDYNVVVRYNFNDRVKYYMDVNEKDTIRKTEPMEPRDYQIRIDHTAEQKFVPQTVTSEAEEEEEDDQPI